MVQVAKRTKFRNWSEKTEIKSFAISILVHCIILCLLSVIVTKITDIKQIKLSLTFSDKNDDIVLLEDNIVTIKEFESQTHQEDIVDIHLPDIDRVVPDALEPVLLHARKQQKLETIKTIEVYPETKNTKIVDDGLDIFGLPKSDGIESNHRLLGENKQISGVASDGGGEIEDKFAFRLSQKNAKTGDVQISILWDSMDDIDLWVEFIPLNKTSRYIINWITPYDASTRGMLDVDCNVSPTTNNPVENVFWDYNGAPVGTYNVYVHYFKQWTNRKNMSVQIRIANDKKIEYRKVLVSYGSAPIKAYSFTRKISKQ